MEIPPFSRWVPIADRRCLPGCQERGLYIVGRFDRCPSGAAKPLHRNVIYIGETHGPRMSIRRRLDYFARAAVHGRAKHSGGRRCFRTLGADLPDLHVAALPIGETDQQRLEVLIFAIERTLIAAYADRWGAMPVCNISAGKGSEIGFEKNAPPAYVELWRNATLWFRRGRLLISSPVMRPPFGYTGLSIQSPPEAMGPGMYDRLRGKSI